MKLNRIITLCAVVATMAASATSLLAQDAGTTTNANNGGQRRNRQGGENFDPAQMQQRLMDGVRNRLGFTNDIEWAAVEPLVKNVVTARFDIGMRGMMGNRNRGGANVDQTGNRSRGGFGGQPNPEADALQKAVDDNAPAAQIKDLLAKCKTSQQAKQAKLEAAQDALKTVLTTKQESQAYMMGLVR